MIDLYTQVCYDKVVRQICRIDLYIKAWNAQYVYTRI